MRRLLITATDTNVGKTWVTISLARMLSRVGERVEIVKPVETGRAADEDGDAERAGRAAGVAARTLLMFRQPLAPLTAARLEARKFTLEDLLAGCLNPSAKLDWQLIEGAGGIAVPLTAEGEDWADLARRLDCTHVVLVVPDRLGAINQARMGCAYAMQRGLIPLVWLNEAELNDEQTAASNREGLSDAGISILATQVHGSDFPENPDGVLAALESQLPRAPEEQVSRTNLSVNERCHRAVVERVGQNLFRSVKVTESDSVSLNLADNDYLGLSRDPELVEAAAVTAWRTGTSSSASPLITGWKRIHEACLEEFCNWHDFPCGMLWSSGFAANAAVLGTLPQKGDLAIADRLIHHSMISGLMRSGARIQRHAHLDLDHLESCLQVGRGRTVFVVSESVYSMDGDYPDLQRLAELKKRHGFFWVLDEAHGVGWYGPQGQGLAAARGVGRHVDVLIGTFGKALSSSGAYTLFRDESVRDFLVNHAGEYIYSTAISPLSVAVATAARLRVEMLSADQQKWHETSRVLRNRLRDSGWSTSDGDSPIIPVLLGGAGESLSLSDHLKSRGIWVGAVRPPTVPMGTSRLRLSIKRGLSEASMDFLLDAMNDWKALR